MSAAIDVQIPEGAEEGDFLEFEVEGQRLEFAVPLGAKPGDLFQIQVGSSDDRQDAASKDDEGVFYLSSGESVDLPHHSNESQGDQTYVHCWPAGRALARFLESPAAQDLLTKLPCRSVLELGSGRGLVGIVFAHIVSKMFSHRPVLVTLTDLPCTVEALRHNIVINSRLYGENVQVNASSLVWHDYPTSPPQLSLDWILLSDVLYNVQTIPALVATILRLSSSSTRILLGVRWRKPDLERVFFENLSQTYTWELIDGFGRLSWQDFGNPHSSDSNLYLSTNSVSVAGVPRQLSTISESDMQDMNDQEFQAWEKMFVQVYLGNPKD